MASGSKQVKNIVLVGKTGNGKSATGNSLVGEKAFISKMQGGGVTLKCQTHRATTTNGPNINVIDTPGLFDLMASPELISKEIVSCLSLAENGLHAVLFVLSVRGRITEEEEKSLCTLQILFGSKILDYLIVVFTGGDDLESNKQTLDTWLATSPPFLKKVFRLCGNRRVLFNNRTTDEDQKEMQIQELLKNVKEIERANGGIPFTDETHRQIQAEKDRLKIQKKAAEARHAKAEIQAMKMHFELRMSQMAQMVEQALEAARESHQQMLDAAESSRQQQGVVSSRGRQVMMTRGHIVVSGSGIDPRLCNIL